MNMRKTIIPITLILIPVLFLNALPGYTQEESITITLEKASYPQNEPLWGISNIEFQDAGGIQIICPPEWTDLQIATVLESKDYLPVSCLSLKDIQGEEQYVLDTDADFDFSDEPVLKFQKRKNMSIAGADILIQPLDGTPSYTRYYEIIIGVKGNSYARIAEYRKGMLRLDKKEYPIILRPIRRNKPAFDLSAGTQCLIDLDRDGDFSLRWRPDRSGNIIAPEQVPLNAPFRIDDQTYQATDVDIHGKKLVIEPVSVKTAPSIGFQAPAFEVTTFDNKTYSLKDFEGQTFLMEFWSPDCRFSEKVRSWVEYIVSKYGDRLTVLSIMIEPDKTEYEEFLKNHTMSSLAVQANDNLKESYNPGSTTPTFFVIDKNGTIQFKGAGISVIEVVDKLLGNIL
jgi:cytochrome c biogenesis protein CcmG, thiol:disulfide interchange protein DsbE